MAEASNFHSNGDLPPAERRRTSRSLIESYVLHSGPERRQVKAVDDAAGAPDRRSTDRRRRQRSLIQHYLAYFGPERRSGRERRDAA